MQIDATGRNPSLIQYIIRGITFFLVLALLFVVNAIVPQEAVVPGQSQTACCRRTAA